MALESVTYISDLVSTNPTSTDPKSQGDDHLRAIKSAVKTTFPNISGAVTPTHTELNYVDGVTSPIQTQIDSEVSDRAAADLLKANKAGDTYAGTHDFTGATVTVPTQSAGDNSTKAASTAFATQLAFAAALPAQPGGSATYVLNSTGGVASWGGGMPDFVLHAQGVI